MTHPYLQLLLQRLESQRPVAAPHNFVALKENGARPSRRKNTDTNETPERS